MNVSATETRLVSQTSEVSGASKFIRSAFAYRARAAASLMRYETIEVAIITMRIAKIHTRSCTCTVSDRTPSRMKLMSATPVTP